MCVYYRSMCVYYRSITLVHVCVLQVYKHAFMCVYYRSMCVYYRSITLVHVCVLQVYNTGWRTRKEATEGYCEESEDPSQDKNRPSR